MNLFESYINIEEDNNLHLGRLLVLLLAFCGDRGKGKINGLTKLAKLDFFLRYPVYLEKALLAKNKSTKNMNIAPHEKLSVESKMVRFKYGPWDFRYRKYINILVAKGLAFTKIEGKTIEIHLSKKGIEKAIMITNINEFNQLFSRAKILKQNFNLTGTNLMKFIYKTFPEIGNLKFGEEINHENLF